MSNPNGGGATAPGPTGAANALLAAAAQQQHQQQQEQHHAALAALLSGAAGGGGAPQGGNPFAGLAGLSSLAGLRPPPPPPPGAGNEASFRHQIALAQLAAAGVGAPPPPPHPASAHEVLLARLLQQQGSGALTGLAGLGGTPLANVPGDGGKIPGAGIANLQAHQDLELQLLQQKEAELARARRQRTVEAEAVAMAAGVRAVAAAGPADSGNGASTAGGGPASIPRAPGSVVVPCRARGMPMDHNFRTAYFVIPETVEHGEELICSYYACRNAGIKFRYCSHCKIPVAKRNFRKRHNHGLMAPRGGRAAVNIGADSDEEEPDTGPASVVNNGGAGSGPANRSCVPAPPLSSAGSPVISADGKSIEPERSSRWAELLRDRPPTGDSNAMSSWLLEVLSVSDLEKPLADKGAAVDSSVGAELAGIVAAPRIASSDDAKDTKEKEEGEKRDGDDEGETGDRKETEAGKAAEGTKEESKKRAREEDEDPIDVPSSSKGKKINADDADSEDVQKS